MVPSAATLKRSSHVAGADEPASPPLATLEEAGVEDGTLELLLELIADETAVEDAVGHAPSVSPWLSRCAGQEASLILSV